MKLTAALGNKADGRRRTIVDVFRTLAWYETVVHCTPYDTPARLEKAFHHDGEGRKRLWERYAKLGRPTPSVTIKGRPGLVAVVGSRYPRTRVVFEHALWVALDPGLVTHTPVVNQLLCSLHEHVAENFFEDGTFRSHQPVRNWFVVEDETCWEYPYEEPELKLDLLAAFLILFREAKDAGRTDSAIALGKRVRAQLHDAQQCIELRRFQPELLRYVLHHFLGTEHQLLDPSVPHFVAEDYVYQPAPRIIYRDRGEWRGTSDGGEDILAKLQPILDEEAAEREEAEKREPRPPVRTP
jgi:hypothetical protein